MERERYYACIEKKDGTIIRKQFKTRQDARNYIADNWDEVEDKSCWTE